MAREQYVDYLLIGGGLACARAIESIRRSDPRGKILLVGREPRFPYDRPPLSKGIITGSMSAKEITFAKRSYYRRNRVKVLRDRKVRLLDLSDEYGLARITDGRRVRFARALIGTGGRARTLRLPGEDLKGVHVLRTLDDALAIRAEAAGRLSPGVGRSGTSQRKTGGDEPARGDTHAVVVGAGFTGTELAASLASAGVKVSLVEARERIWAEGAPVELRDFLRARLVSLGVEVLTSETVATINGGDRPEGSGGGPGRRVGAAGTGGHVTSITTDSAAMLPADMVCIAVGVEPNVELAEAAGLTNDDGIVVDSMLRTSDSRVYAAGDVCRFTDPFSGRSRRVEHYGNAEYGGLLAGENMAVSRSASKGDGEASSRAFDYLTTLWSDIGDLTVETGGDEALHDEFIVRGTLPVDRPDTPGPEISWLAIGMAEGRVSCYYAVNASRADLSALQLLIRGKVSADAARDALADDAQRLPETAHSLLKA